MDFSEEGLLKANDTNFVSRFMNTPTLEDLGIINNKITLLKIKIQGIQEGPVKGSKPHLVRNFL